VTLDVSDGVGQVDSTTESTVSSGETRTGSLTWDVPSDQETGEYTLTTSGGGETDSTTVEIQETPSFDIDVSSTSVRVGDTVSFSAKNVDATNPSYDWDFDDGNTKTGKDVTHTFASEGGYDVELSVTDENGVTETKTVSISVTNSTILDFESGSLQSTWEGTRGGWDVQSSPTYNGNYALVQTDASAARSSIKTTNGPMSDWDPGMTVASHIYVTNNDDYHGSKPRVSLLFDDGSDTHLYLSHNHASDNGGGKVGFSYVEDGTVVDRHGAGGSSSGPDFSQDTWFRWEVTVNADGGYTVTVINTDTGQEKAQFTGPAGTIDTSKLGDEIAIRTGDDPPTGDAFDDFKYVEENP
jgi:PKD repeat protein